MEVEGSWLKMSPKGFFLLLGFFIIIVLFQFHHQDHFKHIHFWHGQYHHHFKQNIGVEVFDEDEVQHKPSNESASHPPGTVVAPMAGLVVKILVKDGEKVEQGQPVLVLEAMKMEHVVKAPNTGYVSGLKVEVGQQIYDGVALFSIKNS
ncbi:PREDICTED: methylcrotonoyl-CoA carboxylase subunit alpha, mitochondrial-like [Ipomoea nil]|uniref:methylcrotonoyl-CoA carboxylase subunit alpha, mitochondrial-like n=1 Tax=Ipomoea nil TaxID=35883 RepID=UPI000901236D|nr:PREDICTED: methylcrotonoyl-CoA carboxylase subunit alpha, mitochondrial-like [Ipomoea nil]